MERSKLISKPIKIFDMREGYGSVKNLLGISDPNVHKINGQWVMFVGGFHTGFKNNLFCLRLPQGESLSSNQWTFDTEPGNAAKARALVEQPPKNSWDGYGLHSPCYVRGWIDGKECERIYYAGRSARTVTDNDKPYQLGYLEKTDEGWQRAKDPLRIEVDTEQPNMLEPKIEYMEGKWRLRYVKTPVESSKTAWPVYTIMYTESEDGISNWTKPKVFFSEQEGYYDSVVIPTRAGFGMAVTRNSNLYERTPYPEQGIWWLTCPRLPTERNDWIQKPVQLLNPARDGVEWYINGMCGPSLQFGDRPEDQDTLYIFFVATTKRINWFTKALQRIGKFQLPPVPSPYYFAIGRMEVHKIDQVQEAK